MKHDEFAFVNHQLAGMLKSGIPLEGALRQLSATMQGGSLRDEFTKLETDLSSGTPLPEALARRQLPDLYRQMIRVGVASNDLPGVLTMLADYYQRVSLIAMRLKGLMVYPLIVLLVSLGLSVFVTIVFRVFTADLAESLQGMGDSAFFVAGLPVMIWMPMIILGLASGLALAGLMWPAWRSALRWRLPGFKEAGLARLASAMNLMLKSGTPLSEALGLLRTLENHSPAARDIGQWQNRLAAGGAKFSDLAISNVTVPPLFTWLVSSAGEDLAEGFRRAAEVYQARAAHRVEMLLYAALPVSILFLAAMLVSQVIPLIRIFVRFGGLLDQLGSE